MLLSADRKKRASVERVDEVFTKLRKNGVINQAYHEFMPREPKSYECESLTTELDGELKAVMDEAKKQPIALVLQYKGQKAQRDKDFDVLSKKLDPKMMSKGEGQSTDQRLHDMYPEVDEEGIKTELPLRYTINISGQALTNEVIDRLGQSPIQNDEIYQQVLAAQGR